MRQDAWYNATPEGEEKSRRDELLKLAEKGDDSSLFLCLPDLDGSEYLLQYWRDAGSVGYGMSGIIPLGWGDIYAWHTACGLALNQDELKIIHMMSSAYVSEYHLAIDPKREAPYTTPVDQETQRLIAESKIKGYLKGLRRDTGENKYTTEDRHGC